MQGGGSVQGVEGVRRVYKQNGVAVVVIIIITIIIIIIIIIITIIIITARILRKVLSV